MLTINRDNEHTLNIKAIRGTVISSTVSPRPGLPTTMHILLSDGIQKSIDVSALDTSCIQGNEVLLILTNDDKILYLKNFASNQIELAKVESGGGGGGIFAILLFIFGYSMWSSGSITNSGFSSFNQGISKTGGWAIVVSVCWFAIAIKMNISSAKKMDKLTERLTALLLENGVDAVGIKIK